MDRTALPVYDGFLRSAERTPDGVALDVDRTAWTYRQLSDRAASIAATLQQRTPDGGTALTAVFGLRSVTSYAGILGALLAGRGYVPLNRTFPIDRTRRMLVDADCRSLVVDAGSEPQLEPLLTGVDRSFLIVMPDRDDVSDVAARWQMHTVAGARGLAGPDGWQRQPSSPEAVAYLLFTSGSTGTPKGVAITHRNVTHFVETMAERYHITDRDRFSQMFDPTFDLSVFDMFVAWERGARVCCPPASHLLNPDSFIRDNELTVWFSVPTVGAFMKRFGVLKENRYPSLRWSLFCGEPLHADVAAAWSASAPHSTVENLYGPTELTVACTVYRWEGERSRRESSNGIVPIGHPLRGMDALVVDNALREVPRGATGELLMAGPQISRGYWRNSDQTARAFVQPPDEDRTFYRTGDRVRRPLDGGPLTYVGRVDHQIKVLGHRVELGEVESALRAEPAVSQAVAIGWPATSGGADSAESIVAFVTGAQVDAAAVKRGVQRVLPAYAVPRDIRVVSELPLNSNGKVDRQVLRSWLKA